MKITAQANLAQLEQVEVTLTVTMKMIDWDMIQKSVRNDAKDNYHWTKVEFADLVQDHIEEYKNKLTSTIEK